MAIWHWLGVGVFSYKIARCFYFAVFAFSSILTWLFRERGASFSKVKSMRDCLETDGSENSINQCFAKEAVLRCVTLVASVPEMCQSRANVR